uniref:HAUS augmin-like complex subunit 6 N-terminal domain-containing protein n=1 Tax=Kalanchoe fedtschenkoi TaxID=63787 RepID=A0A7N0TQA3_KALFE
MAMDREKEREMELESAMYSNCLLLGLDPSVIGIGVLNGIPRVGLFRHSNPKLGEQLLHYLISAIRGPSQSAKDFDDVWPVFDAGQSRVFRKVVLGIISELEEKGAIPKCSARVSALANCYGIRFVELLWQLSVHGLREVHRTTFVADVALNPLPAALTDQAISHASALLPVVKARIALERQRFLNNVKSAVERQAKWSSLAHEMTAEFRDLCAEEAYLQLELETMEDLTSEVQPNKNLFDDIGSSQDSGLREKASHMWESILSHKNQYEVLSSGPIEDLIAHREHRYRISGSSLLASMGQSSQVPTPDLSSQYSQETAVLDERNPIYGSPTIMNWRKDKGLYSSPPRRKGRKLFPMDDMNKTLFPVVDIAEVFRRWTHALEGVQKQSGLLAKANSGEGPELLRRSHYNNGSGHINLLSETLADHEQHLNNFEVLIRHLTALVTDVQKSVRECTKQVHTVTSTLYPLTRSSCGSVSPMHANTNSSEISDTEVTEATPKSSPGKVSVNPPALKLPQLFNLASAAMAKGDDSFSIRNLRKSVREAALSRKVGKLGSSRGSHSECGSEHFLTPRSFVRYSQLATEHRAIETRSQHLYEFQSQSQSQFTDSLSEEHDADEFDFDINTMQELDRFSEFLEDGSQTGAASSSLKSFSVIEEPLSEVFSPALFTDSPLLDELYEDLLAPLSETETAMMDH